MKCVAVGDNFITPDMMKKAIEKYSDIIDEVKYYFFGIDDRKEMRNIVKIIERGDCDTLDLPSGLIEDISDADILMVHLCPVQQRLLSKANKLKAILCNRGGFENIDVEYASSKNIMVLTNPAHNANAVAEYTVGLILCESRNIARAHNAIMNGKWCESYSNSGKIIEIKDLNIGIVGFGNIGALVSKKLKGFDCNILVNSAVMPSEKDPELPWDKIREVSFDELLSEADVITLHARVPDQKVLFDREAFSKMKNTCYFINTARPYMVDYDAMYDALKNHTIGGAAIDVFNIEPLGADNKFLQLDNVTLTNHRGGDTLNSYADSPEMMLNEYSKHIIGKVPKFWINK